MAGKQVAGNALEGTAESIASHVASGAPITPAGLLTTAASGAAISVGTGGVMSKVTLPTPKPKLGAIAPTPQQVTSGPDFIVNSNAVTLPTSRVRMEDNLNVLKVGDAMPTRSPGMQYTMPDGSTVRIMEPSGPASTRASFENAGGNPVDAFSGRVMQPPRDITRGDRNEYIRSRTHVELGF